jgi:hypothetical protein
MHSPLDLILLNEKAFPKLLAALVNFKQFSSNFNFQLSSHASQQYDASLELAEIPLICLSPRISKKLS